MGTTDSELIEILQKQSEIEKKTLTKLSIAEEEASEIAVKLILMELRLDSWKHQKFLEGIVDLLLEMPCDSWSAKVQRYVDRVKVEKTLNELIRAETEMMELAEKAIALTDDPIAIRLLNHLRDDEKYHRKEIEELVRIIQTSPLQSKKAVKGSDIVCATED